MQWIEKEYQQLQYYRPPTQMINCYVEYRFGSKDLPMPGNYRSSRQKLSIASYQIAIHCSIAGYIASEKLRLVSIAIDCSYFPSCIML